MPVTLSVKIDPTKSTPANLLALLTQANPGMLSKNYLPSDFSYGTPAANSTNDGSGNDSQITVSPGNIGVFGDPKTLTYTRRKLSDYTPLTLAYTLELGVDIVSAAPNTFDDAVLLQNLLHAFFPSIPVDEPILLNDVNLSLQYTAGQNQRPSVGTTTTVSIVVDPASPLFGAAETVVVTLTWPVLMSMEDLATTSLSGFASPVQMPMSLPVRLL